jgi:hypothetical protein
MEKLSTSQQGLMASKPNIGRELLDVPMGDMIRDMAFAIADAQIKLDANSIEVAQMLGGIKQLVNNKGEVTFADSRVFFGKEKLGLMDAIALYNSSNDLEFRSNILTNLNSTYYKFNVESSKTFNNKGLMEDSYEARQVGDICAVGSGTATKYYKWFDPTKKTTGYAEAKSYEIAIEKTAAASDDAAVFVSQKVSMLELGFSPTFYQFVDTIIEVKMSISYTTSGSTSGSENDSSSASSSYSGTSAGLSVGWRSIGVSTSRSNSSSCRASSVNASYSQKFSYSAEGSSLLRTKLVPIPPPAILEERIRALMDVVIAEKSAEMATE